mmetsp:Transcript_23300/g.88345  ORF Transcript_23300/g.88345 Transcript_23300/m.88345 type:complete len:247 (+) Transcript_23300:2477-3217(+)
MPFPRSALVHIGAHGRHPTSTRRPSVALVANSGSKPASHSQSRSDTLPASAVVAFPGHCEHDEPPPAGRNVPTGQAAQPCPLLGTAPADAVARARISWPASHSHSSIVCAPADAVVEPVGHREHHRPNPNDPFLHLARAQLSYSGVMNSCRPGLAGLYTARHSTSPSKPSGAAPGTVSYTGDTAGAMKSERPQQSPRRSLTAWSVQKGRSTAGRASVASAPKGGRGGPRRRGHALASSTSSAAKAR